MASTSPVMSSKYHPDYKGSMTVNATPSHNEQPPPYQPSASPELVHRPRQEHTTLPQTNDQATSTPTNPTDEELINLTLRWVPPPPPARPTARLTHPVAIPQVARDSYIEGVTPFMRAFAPSLAAHAITRHDFAAFIDGLTIARAPSPPIQAADLVSEGFGLVPDLWAQIASLGIDIVAGVAAEATIYARSKMFLGKANAEYFGPRGLRVSVLKDEELQQLLGLGQQLRPLAKVDPRNDVYSVSERRLVALEGRIAKLETQHMPVPDKPRNLIDRLSAKQVEARIRKEKKKTVKKLTKEEKKEREREETAVEKVAREDEKEREREEKTLKKVAREREKEREREAKAAKKAGGKSPVSTVSPLDEDGGPTLRGPFEQQPMTDASLSPWTSQSSTYPSSYQDQAASTSSAYTDPPWRPVSSQPPSTPQFQQPFQQQPYCSPPTDPITDQKSTSLPVSNSRIDDLLRKEQQINLDFDNRLLEKDNQKPSKQARLQEKRAERLAEVEKKLEKERTKEEGKQRERQRASSIPESESSLSTGKRSGTRGDEDKDLAKRREEELKLVEKEKQKASKLRWIVIQNLPDHGAFPEESFHERWDESRRSFRETRCMGGLP